LYDVAVFPGDLGVSRLPDLLRMLGDRVELLACDIAYQALHQESGHVHSLAQVRMAARFLDLWWRE
jgi:hypothetical protein